MSDSVSYQQLSMYMPAHEIAKMTMGDRRPGDTGTASVLARKLAHAKKDWVGSSDLYESIKKSGVQEPVQIRHGMYGSTLEDGHHRVAAAMDINPNMIIPITNVSRL